MLIERDYVYWRCVCGCLSTTHGTDVEGIVRTLSCPKCNRDYRRFLTKSGEVYAEFSVDKKAEVLAHRRGMEILQEEE